MRKALFSRERMPRCSPAATNEILHKPFLTLFHFVRITSFLVNTRFPVSGFSGSNSPCFALKQRIEQFTLEGCLGPIILSPLNGPVKMSPHEPGDISLEFEGIATSGSHFIVCAGDSDA